MGNELIDSNGSTVAPMPPWLDRATSSLTEDIVRTLALRRSDLLAVILYGSIARHDERPIDDGHPSDVDLLAIFESDDEQFSLREGKALFGILGQVYNRHLDTLRDVKVMFASRTLREWDSTFIESIAHDGVLLWARGALPAALSSVASRTFVATDRPVIDQRTNAD